MLTALSGISDDAEQLCSELDDAVTKRLSRDWIRGWEEGFSYGRTTEAAIVKSRFGGTVSRFEALVDNVEKPVEALHGTRPPDFRPV
jgi:hypothetical protein